MLNLKTREKNQLISGKFSSTFFFEFLSLQSDYVLLVSEMQKWGGVTEGLSLVKMATFGIIYSTDPLLQNIDKIVCLG